MAVFNGEKYIKDQIISILPQLSKNDEFIIIDDCSKDKSIKIIQKINDPRIQLFQNSNNLGHVLSFNRALELSKGDIILLADQDDLWSPTHVEILRSILLNKNKPTLAYGNFTEFGDSNAKMRLKGHNVDIPNVKGKIHSKNVSGTLYRNYVFK